MPDRRPFSTWPLAVIAIPAAVAIWSGWVVLGTRTGFGVVALLPGIAAWRLNTAITLPVGAEAYGAYALAVWLTRRHVPARARRFAKRSALAALTLGAVGQVAAHLMESAGMRHAPWLVTVIIGCVPVVTLGFAAALTHMLRTEPRPDTARTPDSRPAGRTPAKRTADTRTPRTRTPDSRTPGTRTPTAADTRTLAAAHPDLTQQDIAARLGITDRTVRRHLATANAASNGQHPQES